MLFTTDTKELFSLKMLDGAGIEKAPLTQHVRWGWPKKLFSLKILDGAGIKKAPLSQFVRQGLAQKSCFH